MSPVRISLLDKLYWFEKFVSKSKLNTRTQLTGINTNTFLSYLLTQPPFSLSLSLSLSLIGFLFASQLVLISVASLTLLFHKESQRWRIATEEKTISLPKTMRRQQLSRNMEDLRQRRSL